MKNQTQKEVLEQVINESGIWRGERKNTHAFILSPDVLKISEQDYLGLSKLGSALQDCLFGISHIAAIASDENFNYRGAWTMFRKILSTGALKQYKELQGIKVKHIPKLLKLDLMLDENGNFKIAEIDGSNKRGVGYSTLGSRIRTALHGDKKSLPGVVKMLSLEIQKRGLTEIKLLFGHIERFYIPEFEIVKQEFQRYGINCLLISEMDLNSSHLESGLFFDLPLLYKRPFLYGEIIERYKKDEISFLIPPKPFFGSKGIMAFLKNSQNDEGVEAILRTFIKWESLSLVREYIPITYLIGKEANISFSLDEITRDKKFVLKEAISSGMKGVYFSDESDFNDIFVLARNTKINWILQEEIRNKPQTFSFFNGGVKPSIANDWFMRITAHYVNRDLADIIVTARRDRAVHGAKDCLQIGAVIE